MAQVLEDPAHPRGEGPQLNPTRTLRSTTRGGGWSQTGWGRRGTDQRDTGERGQRWGADLSTLAPPPGHLLGLYRWEGRGAQGGRTDVWAQMTPRGRLVRGAVSPLESGPDSGTGALTQRAVQTSRRGTQGVWSTRLPSARALPHRRGRGQQTGGQGPGLWGFWIHTVGRTSPPGLHLALVTERLPVVPKPTTEHLPPLHTAFASSPSCTLPSPPLPSCTPSSPPPPTCTPPCPSLSDPRPWEWSAH